MAIVDGGRIFELHSYTLTLFVILITIAFVTCFKEEFTDEFVVQVNASDWPEVRNELQGLQTRFVKKIFADFYLFAGGRNDSHPDWLPNLLESSKILKDKVQSFERIRRYTMMSFDNRIEPMAVALDDPEPSYGLENCPTFSDMGVETVWSMGYTGKDIVIAITDAGINTDIPDLQPNIRPDLSYNYVRGTEDITPDQCFINHQYSRLSDHGNKCAGVIGASKNESFGDGIAYEADIVGIKILAVKQMLAYEMCRITFVSSWAAQGLHHALDQVHVYSNSWGTNVDFVTSNELVPHALQTGVQKGRNGKGAIYVFPVGCLADPFANNIHTIAVNSVGCKDDSASFSIVCACTLTSAFGKQKKTEARALHTTSNERAKCTVDFEGTSAATAIISGIIGLALQANPELGWRDVQDLIVQASESAPLSNRNYFIENGAGFRYHTDLGFGLLNAAKFVNFSKTMKPLPEQLMIRKRSTYVRRRYRSHRYEECIVKVPCEGVCINRTESVLANVTYQSPDESLSELILTSPSGTDSLLMDRGQSHVSGHVYRKNIIFKSVNFWGEAARGIWTLTLQLRTNRWDFRIHRCELTVYGTGYLTDEHNTTTVNKAYNIEHTRPDDRQGKSSSTSHTVLIVVLIVCVGVRFLVCD